MLDSTKSRGGLLRPLAFLAAGVALSLFAIACGGSDSEDSTTPSASSSPATDAASANGGYPACATGGASALTGAGASFPFPLYSKWVDEYNKSCRVQINYQSVGSGAGINQITQKTVDFGATDGIMTDAQESAAVAAGGPILHIPMTFAPVAVVYNIPGVNSGALKLSGEVLAEIYLGSITKWNDAKVTALNSGVSLPNADIAVVRRAESSGTSFIFTNYLSKVSPTWSSQVGAATSVNWPVGVGGQGNEGVAGQVRQLPGAIGYVELAYAKQAGLSVAQLRNRAGNFITPSLETATNAAAGITIPDDTKIVITDSTNPQAYPITGFTWVLSYVNQPDVAKGKALASYLWWSTHEAQKFNSALDYPQLSTDAAKKAEAQILKIMCGAAPCLSK